MPLPAFNAKIVAAQTSAEDGRVSYFRFREGQLSKLYDAIYVVKDALLEALQRDQGRTAAEAQLELALTLRFVKARFLDCDFAKMTKQTKDLRKQGVIHHGKGLVAIVADETAPLYSFVAPLAAAIAAGNAAVVLASHVLAADRCKSLTQILLERLPSLDRLAYVFLSPPESTRATLHELLPLGPNVLVTRYADEEIRSLAAKHNVELVATPASPESATASVIVDRNQTDLRRIAKLVVRGKYLGVGKLAGSIDHVLVQKDRASELLELIVEETKAAFGSDVSLSADFGRLSDSQEVERLKTLVRNEVKSGEGKVVLGGSSTAANSFEPTIVEGASTSLLRTAKKGPVLPVVTFLSLEGALATLNSANAKVAYLFAAPDNFDYLASEGVATVVYENDVPAEALIAPFPDQLSPRHYTSNIFVQPSKPSPLETFFAPFTSSKLGALASVAPRDNKLVVRRAPHSNILLRTFFPQGLFLVVGTIGLCLLGSSAFAAFKTFVFVKRRLAA
ncbi:hypothetical protein OIO90_001388 [Microbotryomycetes sp. JL221]|nr:hypothetical protein OIO90_001388 [Microbotryomycetes sp. JL221]